MLAILLFSHGSVLCGAEQSLLALARRMEARGDAPVVEAGFLNYIEPSFDAAVDVCVARGASTIVIAPYFLVAGKFVKQELPPHIHAARERHPGVEIRVAEALRNHPSLASAILASADAAGEPGTATLAEQAERFCRQDPRCPNFGTPLCPATEPTV